MYCWLVSIIFPSNPYTECNMQEDHKSLIRFDKEKELQPLLYPELVSPPFDMDIPNEISDSEEEPEAIYKCMHFPQKKKVKVTKKMVDQYHTIIRDLIINEDLVFPSIPLKKEQVDDFSIFKDIVGHHESFKIGHLAPSPYIGDN